MAQEKFGNLGRLIEEDKYYEPEYIPMVAHTGVVLDADELKLLKSAAIREFASKVAKMEADRPKLYGLIRRHMSVESKDEVAQDKDYPTWSKALDAEKVWQAIVNTHKIDCVSNIPLVFIKDKLWLNKEEALHVCKVNKTGAKYWQQQ